MKRSVSLPWEGHAPLCIYMYTCIRVIMLGCKCVCLCDQIWICVCEGFFRAFPLCCFLGGFVVRGWWKIQFCGGFGFFFFFLPSDSKSRTMYTFYNHVPSFKRNSLVKFGRILTPETSLEVWNFWGNGRPRTGFWLSKTTVCLRFVHVYRLRQVSPRPRLLNSPIRSLFI